MIADKKRADIKDILEYCEARAAQLAETFPGQFDPKRGTITQIIERYEAQLNGVEAREAWRYRYALEHGMLDRLDLKELEEAEWKYLNFSDG